MEARCEEMCRRASVQRLGRRFAETWLLNNSRNIAIRRNGGVGGRAKAWEFRFAISKRLVGLGPLRFNNLKFNNLKFNKLSSLRVVEVGPQCRVKAVDPICCALSKNRHCATRR